MSLVWFSLSVGLGAWSLSRAGAEEPPSGASELSAETIGAEDLEFFEKRVRPLLTQRCGDCHGGTKAAGGLSLATSQGWRRGGESGPALVPGQPNASLLIDAINYRNLEMPPSDAGGRLSDEEIATLTEWVSRGAPDPRDGRDTIGGMSRESARTWWSFQPLPKLTPDQLAQGPAHVDELWRAQLAEHDQSPSPVADKRTLLRRVTYSLTGLPPTSAEVAEFESEEAADAWSRVVDRLLASPQYGVHWGRHWLDVVRYADTAGENTDRPLPHAWRYRNWVLEAFQRDLPYDEFIRAQLAGDLWAAEANGRERAAAIVATGYLAIARRYGHDIDKDMHLTHEDVIDNLGKNFLGLTLGCARCHDHKYDAVAAEDYYALYGIFDSTKFAFPGCEPKGQPRDLVSLLDPQQTAAMEAEFSRQQAEYDAHQQNLAAISARLQPLIKENANLLVAAEVPEGESRAWHESAVSSKAGVASESAVASKSEVASAASVASLERVSMRQGEVLLLTIGANGGFGADTTRVEWEIAATEPAEPSSSVPSAAAPSSATPSSAKPTSWKLTELIDHFTQAGPAISQAGATWCLLDVQEGPTFLLDKKTQLNGLAQLHGWARGDLPSAIVNAGSDLAHVWTQLPPRSLFVHPSADHEVGIAWICPADGTYRIDGRVTDAHPAAGLDGVRFQLQHIRSSDLGSGLMELARQSLERAPAKPTPPVIPVAYAVVEGESKNARLQRNGDPEKLGDEIPRRWLSVFGGSAVSAAGSGRKELSEWVASHPLAARVMVNRIWEWHFGQGLVRSSNDFGARGEQPSHPELLEWLAAYFVQNGYSVKAMHRLILNSAVYQQRSGVASVADPENRLLSHFARRRLTAEEIRDSLLNAAGELDLSYGESHPFPPESTWTFTQHTPFNAIYETNRRSAFLMVQRQRRHPFLALFDGADPNASTPKRQTTTVPTQALYFINDPFFHQQAHRVAQRVLTLDADQGGAPSQNNASRLVKVYQLLFQRAPTEREQRWANDFLDNYVGSAEERWSALARVLLASNEFLHVE